MKSPLRIALIGNPNTGKTSLFNGLCRTRQKTGNFPGTTVAKKSGTCLLKNGQVEILDLPGLYSLHAKSPDEQIACDILLGSNEDTKKPDLLLFIMSSIHLKRNLFLYSQVIELGIPVIVLLTMYDQILSSNNKPIVDIALLQKKLNVSLLPTISHQSLYIEKIKELLGQKYIQNNASSLSPFAPSHFSSSDAEEKMIEEALKKQKMNLSRFEIREMISQNRTLEPTLMKNDPLLFEHIHKSRQKYATLHFKNPAAQALSRYTWIDEILQDVQKETPRDSYLKKNLDRLLTHRVYGLLIFIAIVGLMFQSIYAWADPAVSSIEGLTEATGDLARNYLSSVPFFRDLVVGGVIAGVGSVLVFLPQIVILFFFIAVLEDSGYLARVAFLMDRLLSWSGLNGRAFIPLLSSFACAVPGILSARVIPDAGARINTILAAPFMSCSARLPIYLLFIGAIIEPQFGAIAAAFCLFFMHSIGILVAIPALRLLNQGFLKKPSSESFFMELPPYHFPNFRNVFFRVYEAARKFTLKAGTVILCFSILIWALSYFPRPLAETEPTGNEKIATEKNPIRKKEEIQENKAILSEKTQLENSFLGRFGKFTAPLFAPLGFDWKISIGILGSFPARELLISTLAIIYRTEDIEREKGQEGEDKRSLSSRLLGEKHPDGRSVYTPLTAISLMIFFALCSQCMSTLAIIRTELGSWKWPILSFTYMTLIAYLFSLGIYQIGSAMGY